MEYRIMLAVDGCTTLTLRFLAASWWKIHLHVVEFLSAIFAVFMSVYIYLAYGGVWSLQGSSYICIPSFSLPGNWGYADVRSRLAL